jgi:GNAT superfamily N-acetyltransferase
MISTREYRPEDGPGYVALHNTQWGGDLAIDVPYWEQWAAGPRTASIAADGDEVVGAIPFDLREFVIRPGVTIRAAQEYSVVVHEKVRSTGIGSRLMDEAKQFLNPKADAMTVYRGGERTPGYRFYANNDHFDMVSYRSLTRHEPTGCVPDGIRMVDLDDFLSREEEVIEIFQSAYGCFGGYPMRVSGHYAQAVTAVEYEEMQSDFYVALAEASDGLAGYALLSRWVKGNELHVAEIATRGGEQAIALDLLQAACAQAEQLGTSAGMCMPDGSLYSGIARALGFTGSSRAMSSHFQMAHIIDPPALAQRQLADVPELSRTRIEAFIPEADYVLQAPDRATKTVMLEMKQETLARMLLSRLDLRAALAEERVTALGASAGDMDALARAFPLCRWEYSPVDHI